MKAIVLAAGQGARLRPYTNDRPKCMVEYRGKPLIDYSLEAMRVNGIEDIAVVRGYCAETVERTGVRYFCNPDYDSTNMVHSLFCAESELSGEVVVCYGDIVFRENLLRRLLQSQDDFAVVIDTRWRELWEARSEDPLSDAETLILDDDGFIKELGKKPKSLDEIQGQYIGLFKWSEAGCRAARELYHSLDREILYDGKPFERMFMTSFLQEMINRKMPARAVMVAGGWLEIDAPADLGCSMVGSGDRI